MDFGAWWKFCEFKELAETSKDWHFGEGFWGMWKPELFRARHASFSCIVFRLHVIHAHSTFLLLPTTDMAGRGVCNSLYLLSQAAEYAETGSCCNLIWCSNPLVRMSFCLWLLYAMARWWKQLQLSCVAFWIACDPVNYPCGYQHQGLSPSPHQITLPLWSCDWLREPSAHQHW